MTIAGMADRNGVHSSQELGRAEDIRYGLLTVPHAVTPCNQTRIWRLESVGGHLGYCTLQGKMST